VAVGVHRQADLAVAHCLRDHSWENTVAAVPERREPIRGEYSVITTEASDVDMFDPTDRCVAAWDSFLAGSA